VRLADAQPTVATGGSTTADIVLEDATDGVSAYRLQVTSSDTGVVTLTDASPAGDPQFPTEVSASGQQATIEVGYGDNQLPGATAVTLATVTLEGQTRGSADLEVTVDRVDDTTQEQYTVTNAPYSVPVTVTDGNRPTVVGSDPVTDPDGDGDFEDIDGNGQVDIFDVQALFTNLESDPISNNPGLFNFDGQGGVDVFDVQALFTGLS
jgi:PKD repeat protein